MEKCKKKLYYTIKESSFKYLGLVWIERIGEERKEKEVRKIQFSCLVKREEKINPIFHLVGIVRRGEEKFNIAHSDNNSRNRETIFLQTPFSRYDVLVLGHY